MPERQMMLNEVLLNPSVKVEDELRLSQQAMKMWKLFKVRDKIGLPVSTADLMEIGDQYQARLFELRRQLINIGLCIDLVKKGEGGINYYALVSLENSTFYRDRKGKL